MTGPRFLPELGEADSEGEVEGLYADIRATLGIPFVGLIYRTLAVEPGRLAAAWRQLRPVLAHDDTWRAAAGLDPGLAGAPAIAPAGGLSEAGFDTRFGARASATLDAFDHMNRLNLLGLSALLEPSRPAPGAFSQPADGVDRTPRWIRDELLSMPELDALPAEDHALLLQISQKLLGAPGPVLVPSLLRHFALPGLLQPLWRSIRPAVDGGFVPAAAAGLRRQAFAVPLPPLVRIDRPADPGLIEAAERFVVATSTMVVTGALLERALRFVLPDATSDRT